MQADREKELKAIQEAEACRLEEEAARKAAIEEEERKEEEFHRKMEEEQVIIISYVLIICKPGSVHLLRKMIYSISYLDFLR